MRGMMIGILVVEYALHGMTSLKDKRRIAESVKRKVRNQFNVAVAEVGSEDAMTRLRLCVVSVSNDRRHLESRLEKALAHMEACTSEEMVYSDIEVTGWE